MIDTAFASAIVLLLDSWTHYAVAVVTGPRSKKVYEVHRNQCSLGWGSVEQENLTSHTCSSSRCTHICVSCNDFSILWLYTTSGLSLHMQSLQVIISVPKHKILCTCGMWYLMILLFLKMHTIHVSLYSSALTYTSSPYSAPPTTLVTLYLFSSTHHPCTSVYTCSAPPTTLYILHCASVPCCGISVHNYW